MEEAGAEFVVVDRPVGRAEPLHLAYLARRNECAPTRLSIDNDLIAGSDRPT